MRPAGLDWITALKAKAIQAIVAQDGFQPSLFDERRLAEITLPDYPGERLVVCRNPDLARHRTRKRQDLLAVTETKLEKGSPSSCLMPREMRSRSTSMASTTASTSWPFL